MKLYSQNLSPLGKGYFAAFGPWETPVEKHVWVVLWYTSIVTLLDQ